MVRWAYFAFGFFCTALGIIGAFLPVMPTTIFLILALWAFAKSCPHMESWLLTHPQFGEGLRNWQNHNVVPKKAKILMTIMMVASLALTTYIYLDKPLIPGITGVLMLAVCCYVYRLPSRVEE